MESNETNESNVRRYKTLVVDSVRYRTTLNKKFDQRKRYEPPNPKLVLAVIPGTIVKIHVKQGQKVEEGDRLLILEAMKMKNDVVAPIDGVVKVINVQEGEKVPKMHLLIEIG